MSPVADRVGFSGRQLSIHEIARHHADVTRALRDYFGRGDPVRFAGYTAADITTELAARLDEADLTSVLITLTSLEAAFRIDYLRRCYERRKDELSRKFRALYKIHQHRIPLEDEIFQAWKDHSDASPQMISDLRSAFKLRHWLAHGRFWTPKLGRTYDFHTVYALAHRVLATFPLLN